MVLFVGRLLDLSDGLVLYWTATGFVPGTPTSGRICSQIDRDCFTIKMALLATTHMGHGAKLSSASKSDR